MTQIKTKVLETSKARVLVVGGLPEDVPKWGLAGKAGKPPELLISVVKEDFDCFGENVNPKYVFDIPKGNWQRLGKLNEITEEQWKGIVEEIDNPYGNGLFMDYRLSDRSHSTATESGLSLIESELFLRNPHGEKPAMPHSRHRDAGQTAGFVAKMLEWQAAEDQVFHNPVILWEKK